MTCETLHFSMRSSIANDATTPWVIRYLDLSPIPPSTHSICTDSMRSYVTRKSLACFILFALETSRILSKKWKTWYLAVELPAIWSQFFKLPGASLIKATQPLEKQSIDFMGPNKFLLTIVNEFSGFLFAFSWSNIYDSTVTDCLIQLYATLTSLFTYIQTAALHSC